MARRARSLRNRQTQEKVLEWGLDTSDEAMARDAYDEVGPGGHFLGSAHTLRNYLTAFYAPPLSDSENVESWEEAGSTDMRQRAYERWNTMLEAYENRRSMPRSKWNFWPMRPSEKRNCPMPGIKAACVRAPCPEQGAKRRRATPDRPCGRALL